MWLRRLRPRDDAWVPPHLHPQQLCTDRRCPGALQLTCLPPTFLRAASPCPFLQPTPSMASFPDVMATVLFCCPGSLAHSRGAACSRKGFHGAVSCERAWQLHQRAALGTYRCRTLPPRLTVATELLAPRTPEAHASAQLSRCATHRRASYALGPLVFVLFHYYYCVKS